MSNTLVRDAIIISMVFSAGIAAFVKRDIIYEYMGVNPQDIADARAKRYEAKFASPKQPEEINKITPMQDNGFSYTINKSKDGQYWAQAKVNATQVKFLIDTGASVVVLTPADAQKAGLRPDDLTYNAPMSTAAGKIMAAPVDIAHISIGDITVNNVRAVVIKKGLAHSLLGMSYLGELQKLEVTPDEMILRQ